MKKEKILTDIRLIDWLYKLGVTEPNEVREFLNPSATQLHHPMGLLGIKEAAETITDGIKNNKKFVIVGDYDCDGIMASTVVYQCLKAQNARVDVFIPNRFDDGYGLNLNLAQEIIKTAAPDILITVDLGISCAQEVEFLKNNGVTVIVTDHHEPQAIIPDCIVVDPKIKQDYACSFLCGTGVAYKLVSAIAGFDFANNFLDVVSIATIGDIVPLKDENRAIAAMGLERLNHKNFSLKSLEYLFKELKIEHVTSTDIYLKVVPKINASGRMDNGKKVFDFLNTSDDGQRKKLLASILADNALRLDEITRSVEIVNAQIAKMDVINLPIICVKGEFHQGVLGIIASRIINDFGRPALVFAPTENGMLKASGRAVDGIDLHGAVEKLSHLCEHFGGHKLAIGLEIKQAAYDEFVALLCNEIRAQIMNTSAYYKQSKPDIAITLDDITPAFLDELSFLAPFGCENPKPTFGLAISGAVGYSQIGAAPSGHLKLNLGKGKSAVFFSGKAHAESLEINAPKTLFCDLEYNYFGGKVIPQVIVKKVSLNDLSFDQKNAAIQQDKFEAAMAIIASKNINSQPFKPLKTITTSGLNSALSDPFGTIIIASTQAGAARLKNLTSKVQIVDVVCESKSNCVLINPDFEAQTPKFCGFKRIVFLDDVPLGASTLTIDGAEVLALDDCAQPKLASVGTAEEIREKCAFIYSIIYKKLKQVDGASRLQIAQSLRVHLPQFSVYQIAVSLSVLIDVGVLKEVKQDTCLTISTNETNQKRNLDLSAVTKYFSK